MPHFLTQDGTRIFYQDQGQGLPILALSGLTRNTEDFDFVAPHLAQHRLIRMDYRGRGLSDWPGPSSYTILQEARDALALLDHLGLEKTALLGTSRGGLIGMLLAQMAKERLLGVCLNDVGPVIDTTGIEAIKAYLGKPPAQKTHAAMAEATAKSRPGFANVPAARWLAEAQRHYVQTPGGLELRYDGRLWDAVFADGVEPPSDPWSLFEALDGLPIALIWGIGSDILAQDTVQEMSRRRPDMILAEVQDRGHVPFLDEPASLEALSTWIKAMSWT